MTKVEELSEDMVFLVQGCSREFFEKYAAKLNELVAAAEAQGFEKGKAEGAEQERERIRKAQLCGYHIWVQQFPNDERRNCRVETDVNGVAYTLVPASVLTPKEADNGK